jgi:3-oxo-5-alpha-steroid 4-dehydrogenase 1
VSSPNYLGELLTWTGFAIASWSPAGLSFVVMTAANLVPRALSNHRWYQREFADYPPERKAILPWVL